MAVAEHNPLDQAFLNDEIAKLLSELGSGKVEGVAYDTAWCGRLHVRYPNLGFDACLEWLRENQHEDGSWGASVVHHHDRFISTIAAVVALREAGNDRKDEERIKRGERALWQHVGKLRQDDSDTIGFPIIALSLAEDAMMLGLDVPMPSLRYAEAYRKKVDALLKLPERNWLHSPLSHSLEALRRTVHENDPVLSGQSSVGISPAATAGYLLVYDDPSALKYLLDGRICGKSLPAVVHIDIFETAWSLIHLAKAAAITPNTPYVPGLLDLLSDHFDDVRGASPSSDFRMTDLDDTSAVLWALDWGHREIHPDVVGFFEDDSGFVCYHGETNPSLSAHVRLLLALVKCYGHDTKDHPWTMKILNVLRTSDENGSYYWDKWHASPYYASAAAVEATFELAPDIAYSRLKWILRTQNEDGGWGYHGKSSPEETAYCLSSLLYADDHGQMVDQSQLDAAAQFLRLHYNDPSYTALWIGKSLYTPYNVTRAAILGTLYAYVSRNQLAHKNGQSLTSSVQIDKSYFQIPARAARSKS